MVSKPRNSGLGSDAWAAISPGPDFRFFVLTARIAAIQRTNGLSRRWKVEGSRLPQDGRNIGHRDRAVQGNHGEVGADSLAGYSSVEIQASEIVFPFHRCSSYCCRSRAVAGRAEINRIRSLRHVYTTTNTRPRASVPTVIQRSSCCVKASYDGIVASTRSRSCFRRSSGVGQTRW